MYKKEKSMIHPGRLLLLGIGIAAALLGGCGNGSVRTERNEETLSYEDADAGRKRSPSMRRF